MASVVALVSVGVPLAPAAQAVNPAAFGPAYADSQTSTNPGTWVFRARDNAGNTVPGFPRAYGDASKTVPLLGDWDGDGTFSPGIADASPASNPGQWVFRAINTNGTTAAGFPRAFGSTSSKPLVGDWDGDGTFSPGLAEPGPASNPHEWVFRAINLNGTAAAGFPRAFGLKTTTPLVGDWDGDRKFSPGIAEPGPSTNPNQWVFRAINTNGAGAAGFPRAYGAKTTTPLVGDWDGDGTYSPGVAEPGPSTNPYEWVFRAINLNGAGATGFPRSFGLKTTTPLVGRFAQSSPAGLPAAPATNTQPAATGSPGTYTPRAAHVKRQIEIAFPGVNCFTYAGSGSSDHATGNAIDCAFGPINQYPTDAQRASGDRLATWLRQYATSQKIDYLIWSGRIWSAARASEGWRTYCNSSLTAAQCADGPSNADEIRLQHYDHVHTSVQS